MKYLIILVSMLSLIFLSNFVVFAQEDTITIPETSPETAADPAVSENPPASTEPGQSPAQNQQPSLTSQKVTTSTLSCVKVGNPPEEEKASVCTAVSAPESGFQGPIFGGGPTLEDCGLDPEGNPIQCIKPGYVFYCQGDPRWGSTCSLSSAGCGPTTMAMIFSAYGDTITPPDMDKLFQQKGFRSCGDNPSYMQSAIQKLLPENGYEYHALGAPLNLARAQEFLNAGYLIIGSTFGHIFVIDGVDPSANILKLRDPGRCENKDGVYRSASAPWGGQPLTYTYAVKKRAN